MDTKKFSLIVILAIGIIYPKIIYSEGNNGSGSVSITMSAGELKLIGNRIKMEGFRDFASPGRPIVPAKIYHILIGPGQKFRDIEIKTINQEIKPLDKKLRIAPLLFNPTTMEEVSIEPLRGKIYPSKKIEFLGEGQKGVYNYVTIRFYPIQIDIDKYKLIKSSLDVKINTTKGVRTLGAARNWISAKKAQNYFNNFKAMERYYKNDLLTILNDFLKTGETAHKKDITPPPTIGSMGVESAKNKLFAPESKLAESKGIVIITTNSIYNSAKGPIDKYKAHKESLGYYVEIITEDIYSQFPGINTTVQVRNFLKDYYLPWGIEYVLIIANDIDIPMARVVSFDATHMSKELFEKLATAYEINDFNKLKFVPTDFYFSDLSDTWEWANESKELLEKDFYSNFETDVAVGRIMLPNINSWSFDSLIYYYLNRIIERIIRYENDSLNPETDKSWRSSALLLGNMIRYEEADYNPLVLSALESENKCVYSTRIDGAEQMEELDNAVLKEAAFSNYKLYEGGKPSFDSPPSNYYDQSDEPITRDNVLTQMGGPYGLAFWTGHGSPKTFSRYIIKQGYDGLPENIKSLLLNDNDSSELADDKLAGLGIFKNHWPIIFSGACYNALPEKNNNILHSFLNTTSIATIGSTRVSYAQDIDDKSPLKDNCGYTQLMTSFTSYLLNVEPGTITGQMAIGDALAQAKEVYHYICGLGNYFPWDTSMGSLSDRQMNFEYTLYGDPSVMLRRDKILTDFPFDEVALKEAEAIPFSDATRGMAQYKELTKLLDKYNKDITVISSDIDNDGLDEIILFRNPGYSGKAYAFESPKEGALYIGSMRFPKEIVSALLRNKPGWSPKTGQSWPPENPVKLNQRGNQKATHSSQQKDPN